eukprot:Colp12_sorted_trinity150504_noHs@2871
MADITYYPILGVLLFIFVLFAPVLVLNRHIEVIRQRGWHFVLSSQFLYIGTFAAIVVLVESYPDVDFRVTLFLLVTFIVTFFQPYLSRSLLVIWKYKLGESKQNCAQNGHQDFILRNRWVLRHRYHIMLFFFVWIALVVAYVLAFCINVPQYTPEPRVVPQPPNLPQYQIPPLTPRVLPSSLNATALVDEGLLASAHATSTVACTALLPAASFNQSSDLPALDTVVNTWLLLQGNIGSFLNNTLLPLVQLTMPNATSSQVIASLPQLLTFQLQIPPRRLNVAKIIPLLPKLLAGVQPADGPRAVSLLLTIPLPGNVTLSTFYNDTTLAAGQAFQLCTLVNQTGIPFYYVYPVYPSLKALGMPPLAYASIFNISIPYARQLSGYGSNATWSQISYQISTSIVYAFITADKATVGQMASLLPTLPPGCLGYYRVLVQETAVGVQTFTEFGSRDLFFLDGDRTSISPCVPLLAPYSSGLGPAYSYVQVLDPFAFNMRCAFTTILSLYLALAALTFVLLLRVRDAYQMRVELLLFLLPSIPLFASFTGLLWQTNNDVPLLAFVAALCLIGEIASLVAPVTLALTLPRVEEGLPYKK